MKEVPGKQGLNGQNADLNRALSLLQIIAAIWDINTESQKLFPMQTRAAVHDLLLNHKRKGNI